MISAGVGQKGQGWLAGRAGMDGVNDWAEDKDKVRHQRSRVVAVASCSESISLASKHGTSRLQLREHLNFFANINSRMACEHFEFILIWVLIVKYRIQY